MSNYSQTTFFTPKDALPPGNPAKTIKGVEFDPEFAAISAAIATKVDTAGGGVDVTGTTVSLDTSGLTAITAVEAGDFLSVQDVSDSNNMKKVTLTNFSGSVAQAGDTAINNSAEALRVDILNVTFEGAVDPTSDGVLVYDGSAGANRRTAPQNLVEGAVSALATVNADGVDNDDQYIMLVDGGLRAVNKEQNGYTSRSVAGAIALVEADGDGFVLHNSGGAQVAAVPTSGVTVGWRTTVINSTPSDAIIIGPGSGVTMSSVVRSGVSAAGNHTISAGGSAEVIYIATNHWHIRGDIA